VSLFAVPDFSEFQSLLHSPTTTDVEAVLQKDKLHINDLATLLSPAAGEMLPALALRSAAITSQRFGHVIQMYAPVYVSSFCNNNCVYCGFSAENKIARRMLSLDEAEVEMNILADRGFSHVLLVSGEAPGKVGVAYLAELARRTRDRFAALTIEVQPLSSADYCTLFEAGITGVAVYQETYDRAVYEQVHLAGKKADYDYRLETPARAAEAGMREVGIGALMGLSDWRSEGLVLGMHLAWLRKHFWRTNVSVSFPRMRPAEGAYEPPLPAGEKELTQLLFALRIFDWDVGLVLSTREEERYRNGMIGLGPTRYSAGSCTAPGGYANPEIEGEQFSVGDHRDLQEVCASIRLKNHDPVCKDWDATFQKGF
jgi:2-iminoacetate synthase